MKIKQYLSGVKMNSVIEDIERIYKPAQNGAQFTFPTDFVAFKGHFPQQQLLPAVIQVELALFVLSKDEQILDKIIETSDDYVTLIKAKLL